MWNRKRKTVEVAETDAAPGRLQAAIREVRVEAAERTSVVVDLRDAELARLELLNETLDPVFAEIPAGVDLFDRGISQGDPPRLWLDAVAHVVMGRDKRQYRFVQDTRYGRKVLAESSEIAPIAAAVTHYIASRLVERERSLTGDRGEPARAGGRPGRRRGRTMLAFLSGILVGCAALFAALWIVASQLP